MVLLRRNKNVKIRNSQRNCLSQDKEEGYLCIPCQG